MMPLARGTAAVGLCALHAMLLAVGVERAGSIPHAIQVDWEAILASSPDEFQSALAAWSKSDRALDESAWSDVPRVAVALPTMRAVFETLNAADTAVK